MIAHTQTGLQEKTRLSLTLFQDLIAEKTGIHIKQNQFSKLEFAIQEQMLKRDITSTDTYFKNITLQPEEFYHLVGRLTVNETYFLREPAYMELFSGRLIPELLSGKKKTIKIVSAGCSTGPEPYSLAMMLMETYGPDSRNLFSIIGFDIDQYALKLAQEGVYGKYSFRNFNPDLKKQYFQSLGKDRYRIKAHVQEMVDFLHLNLLNNDYPPALKGVDIIFYRNVSIYFAPAKQEFVFKKLLSLLNPGGYIITSAAEVHRHDSDIITSKEVDGLFIFCKSDDQYKPPSPLRPDAPVAPDIKTGSREMPRAFSQLLKKTGGIKVSKPASPGHSPPKKSQPDTETLFRKASGYVQTKAYDKALQLLDNLITTEPGFIKAWTLKAAVLMNRNDLAGARSFCYKAIKTDPLCFEGYFLAGLIAKLENDPAEAIKRFQESLYIDPSCWLSHFYLAEIYRFSADTNKAIFEYQSVIRYIEEHGVDIQGPAFPYISFTAGQIRHLCEYNIDQLKSSPPRGG